VEAGESLTNEAIQAYNLAKGSKHSVTLAVLPPEAPKVKGERPTLQTLFGGVLQAIGFHNYGKDTAPTSKPLAAEKRRGRIFDKMQLGKPTEKEQK
jgi:hypothetical protein